MKNSTFYSLILSGIAIIAVWYMFINDGEYMKFKIRHCTVIDKLQSNGSYENSGNFYLVLKEERGIVFDIIVSPATYSQAKIGSSISFDLRNFDIKQTQKENVLYFFGDVVVVLIGIVFILLGFLLKYLPR